MNEEKESIKKIHLEDSEELNQKPNEGSNLKNSDNEGFKFKHIEGLNLTVNEGASTSTSNAGKDSTYIKLRTRKVYEKVNKTRKSSNNLRKYLQNFLNETRELGSNTLQKYDLLDKKLTQTRESRLKTVKLLNENTASFKDALKQFSCLKFSSHSDTEIELAASTKNNLSSADFILNWEEISSPKDSSQSEESFNNNENNSLKSMDSIGNFEESSSREHSPQLEENNPIASIPNKSSNMANLSLINQLVNSVPVLWGENTQFIEEEINTFVKCSEQLLTCLTEEQDKRIFLTLIPTKFRGRAARLLEGTVCTSFEDIKKALKSKLVSTKPYLVLVNELRMCKQIPGETITNFGNRITQLLKSCKNSAKDRHTNGVEAVNTDLEEIAMFSFKSGLINPTYRLISLQSTENSLEKLITCIEKIEQTEKQMTLLNTTQTFELQNTNSVYNQPDYLHSNIMPYQPYTPFTTQHNIHSTPITSYRPTTPHIPNLNYNPLNANTPLNAYYQENSFLNDQPTHNNHEINVNRVSNNSASNASKEHIPYKPKENKVQVKCGF